MLPSRWGLEPPDLSEPFPRAGLRSDNKGTHTSRTIMLAELTDLLAAVPASANRHAYDTATIHESNAVKRAARERAEAEVGRV